MQTAYLMLAASVTLGAVGQVLLKWGASKPAASFIAQFLDPIVISGLGVYFVAAIFYTTALKQLPLSVAFPSVSASYAIVALLAFFIWKEPFGAKQIAAFILILAGVYLLNKPD
ncbi:MAG: EamA family transporter [Cyanobacteria bacterium P01_F01_bin.153]